MRKLRAFEDVLIRVESALAVVLVLTMLLLAAYNVVYRNVLMPLQQHWAHSGPPLQPTVVEAGPTEATPAPTRDVEAAVETKTSDAVAGPVPDGGADDFGGFGGGLGDDESEPAGEPAAKAPEPKPAPRVAVAEPAKPASDDFGGFGGGLGDDEGEAEPPKAPAKAASDDFGGFGGGLGDEGADAKAGDTKAAEAKAAEAKADRGGEPAADDLGEDDLGEDDLGDDDQFANLADIDAVAKKSADAIPQGGPPPPGSFAAWAVAFIDDLKLDWIDIFLRQLVIIVAFFGAMLATQRGKHINVDALSKMLPPGARQMVGVVLPLTAVVVCLVLARAGWDLVRISREYPKDLLPAVPEWSLQLMFPVGFGLLALHFVVRAVEAVAAPPPRSDARQAASEKGGQG